MGALGAPQPGGLPRGGLGGGGPGGFRPVAAVGGASGGSPTRCANYPAALITPLPADEARTEPVGEVPRPRCQPHAGGLLPWGGGLRPLREMSLMPGCKRGSPGPNLASRHRGAPSSHPQPPQGPALCRQGAACRRPPLTPQPLSPSPSPPPALGQQPRVPAEPQCAWLRAAMTQLRVAVSGGGGGGTLAPQRGAGRSPPSCQLCAPRDRGSGVSGATGRC